MIRRLAFLGWTSQGDAVFRSIRRNLRFAEMNPQISPSFRIACSRAAAHWPPA
jgi:hypothetical protein